MTLKGRNISMETHSLGNQPLHSVYFATLRAEVTPRKKVEPGILN